jgi:hypothetical protein
MLLKKGSLTANLDIHILYVFEPEGEGTNIVRTLDFTIEIPLLLRFAKPIILSGLSKENVRILAELKRYVEANAKDPSASG